MFGALAAVTGNGQTFLTARFVLVYEGQWEMNAKCLLFLSVLVTGIQLLHWSKMSSFACMRAFPHTHLQ